MPWIPPIPRKPPLPDDYLELGHDESPRTWVPVGIGMLLVLLLLVVATIQGKI